MGCAANHVGFFLLKKSRIKIILLQLLLLILALKIGYHWKIAISASKQHIFALTYLDGNQIRAADVTNVILCALFN